MILKLPLHPYFFTLFTFLFLFKENRHELALQNVLFPLFISLCFVFVMYLLTQKLVCQPAKAGVVISIFTLLFFNYGRVYSFAFKPPAITSPIWFGTGIALLAITASVVLYVLWKRRLYKWLWAVLLFGLISLFLRNEILLPLYTHIIRPIHFTIVHPYLFLATMAASFLAVSVWIWKSRYQFKEINYGLHVFSAVLVVLIVFQILFGTFFNGDTLKEPFSEETFPYLPFNATAAKQQTVFYPDIYYIILDGYAGQETLKKVYGFSNSQFTHSLKERGFYVPSTSRSNYLTTFLSLPSSLNMIYLDFLMDNPGRGSMNRNIPNAMIQYHTVGRNLQQLGYEYVHFSSVWGPTASSSIADVVYDSSHLNEFSYLFLWSTPLRFFLPSKERATFLYTFEQLPTVVGREGPTFVFAHVTLPHPPYLFDEEGNELSYTPFEPEQWMEKEKYIAQIQYLNGRTLELVDYILRHSENEPIIILQGDHGTESVPGWTKNPDLERLDERSLILNAYHLPDNRSLNLPDTISPANTFRIIFNEYFGQNYPLLPDRTYFSDYTTTTTDYRSTPYDFRLVYENGKYVDLSFGNKERRAQDQHQLIGVGSNVTIVSPFPSVFYRR